MAGKKNISAETLDEVTASDGISHTADPYASGDSSRSADKSGGESSYSSSTKSEVLSAIMNHIGGLDKGALGNIYKGLQGASGSATRAADKSGGEGSQLRISVSDADPVTGAKLANAGGSAPTTYNTSTGKGERGQIRTSSTSVVAKEDVEEIFGGDELSEELKEKATVVFEAAISARLVSEVARLEEEFETRLEESVESIRGEIVENVDKYLSYAVEQWIEENQVAIDTGLKNEMAEEFMSGLKSLFEANYIDIPETKVDVVAEMVEKIEELELRLNEEIEKNISLQETTEVLQVEEIFSTVAEGLAKTQAEKLRELAEGVSYQTVEEFEKKINIIKETYFPSSSSKSTSTTLTEEVGYSDEEASDSTTGPMAAYIQAVSRQVKN
jgi:hypothetical protein